MRSRASAQRGAKRSQLGPLELTFIASGYATADNVDIPNVLEGDLIYLWQINTTNNTPPTEPTDWTSLATEARSTFAASRLSERVAVSDGEFTNSGAGANTVRVTYAHYRPAAGRVLASVGAPVTLDAASATTLAIQALVTPGAASWGVSFTFTISSVTISSGNTKEVRRAPSSNRVGIVDSNGPTAGTYSGETWTMSGTHGGMMTMSVELGIT